MKLFSNTKQGFIKDRGGENALHVEIIEVVLVLCNIANNDYQHDSIIFHTFFPQKSFGQLLDISPNKLKICYRST